MHYFKLFIMVLLISACSQLPPTPIPLPSDTQNMVVVTDIDGTLTPINIAMWSARPSAADSLNLYADKGYKIVYLSARHSLFQSGLPDWLQENDFPSGEIHVAQTSDERSHPELYKAKLLNDYITAGWKLTYAYGDSSTDFTAYADAHLPKEAVFALRRWGNSDCLEGDYEKCLDGWETHLSYIEKMVPSVK